MSEPRKEATDPRSRPRPATGPEPLSSRDEAALDARLARIYQALARINQAIVRAKDEAALLEELCTIAVGQGGYVLAWVGLVDAEGYLQPLASAGPSKAYAETIRVSVHEQERGGAGPSGQALRSGTHVICNDFLADPLTAPWHALARTMGIRASAAMPLIDEGRVVGLFNVYSDTVGDFGEHEVALLDDMVADISLGLSKLRATAELKRSAEQRERVVGALRRIQQTMRAGVFQLTLPERAVSWSGGVAMLLGLAPEAPADWTAFERALVAGDAAALGAAIADAGRGDGALELDVQLRDGAWLRIIGRVQPTAGGLELQGTMQDVTARRRTEERKAQLEVQARRAHRMQALGVLAGGLAGEFAGAIAAIEGHLSLARKDARRNPRVLRSLAVCSRACRSAAALTRQILTFSRGQSTGPKVMALARVVEDAAALLRASLPPGHDVVFRASADVPLVRIDEPQIQQAVVNLGIRAGQSLAGQPGVIEIDVGAEGGEGGAATITVTVHGPGPDAVREHEGPRLPSPGAEDAEAGLEVVEEIVREHGGTLSGGRGPGATVRIALPAAPPAAAEEPKSRNKTQRRVQPPGAGQRILFVDDHKWLLVLVERLLAERGYQAHGYTSSAAALEALHAEPESFDLIVTDYKMPGSTGFDIIRAVKALRPDMPVVLVSGYVSEKVAEQARRAGADAVLAKQALATDLLPLLSQLLSRAGPGDGAA
ncbi:MAG TPA: GAF domain-containing protein [Steroidobacteraceae bacterium]|nr:GAF domain-containing protein [Steroidobacteraceae bacterium]